MNQNFFPFDSNEDTLSLLNTLYLDARSPGQLGLLPSGQPSTEEACQFAQFARETMKKIKVILNHPPE